MKFKKQTGFTLIELLVVIAIIGILASIVLVSFPGAQKKAKDSRVVGGIAQMRTVMAYIEANTGTYATFGCTVGTAGSTPCTSCLDSDLLTLCSEIKQNNSGQVGPVFAVKTTSPYAGCVYALLNQKSNYWYCADSTGKAGFTSTNPNTTCTATTATCPTDVSG